MKLNPSGDDAGHFQQIINEMRQLAHLTLQNDFGFPLNWVLGVFETKDMQGIEDRRQGIAFTIARMNSWRCFPMSYPCACSSLKAARLSA